MLGLIHGALIYISELRQAFHFQYAKVVDICSVYME